VADAEGRYLDANRATTELLGYAREELLHLRVADVVATGPEWTEAEYARFLREGSWHGELELRRKDGALVAAEAWATTIRLPDGVVYVSAVRDISERRALERTQREFIAMVTHELRTPVTSIKGFAQLMQRRGPKTEMIDVIAHQADRLQRLVEDLLDVSRLDARQLELRPSSVDLAALARAAADQAGALSEEHAVVVEVSEGPLEGWWDPDRLGQVLHNLLTNAIKYSPSGGEVRVRVEDLGQQARVSVADQGIGIAADALPRLFNRFYRTEAAAASGTTGLGVGLYIAKSLVEAHGGQIWADSGGEGHGTTFTFTLPYEPIGQTEKVPG
jgi:two-component system, OmpR family, phosphate regulon sensor histidine kinase PhoR